MMQIYILYYLRDIIGITNAKAYTAILCILSQVNFYFYQLFIYQLFQGHPLHPLPGQLLVGIMGVWAASASSPRSRFKP